MTLLAEPSDRQANHVRKVQQLPKVYSDDRPNGEVTLRI